MCNGKSTLCRCEITTIGSTPLCRENHITNSSTDHGTQWRSEINLVTYNETEFHTEVRCENSHILGIVAFQNVKNRNSNNKKLYIYRWFHVQPYIIIKPKKNLGLKISHVFPRPRIRNWPGSGDIIIVDSPWTWIVDNPIGTPEQWRSKKKTGKILPFVQIGFL